MSLPILDTHLHLTNKSRLSYPWLANFPALDQDWPLATYAKEARKIGITGAIHMEVDVADHDIDAETGWIEELADEDHFPIRGIITACRPESPDFPAWLDRTVDRDRVVGLRRPLHVVPDETSQSALFRDHVARLAGPDLPFDLCATAQQLPLVIDLVDAAPNVRFMLDHCGVPDIAGEAWTEWADNIAKLAERQNVWCKISGVVAYGGEAWALTELSRWVDHVVTAFGTHRIVWGGDWPVCTLGGGLSVWVAATRAIVEDWSMEDRTALYSRNAEAFWRV